MHRRQLHVVDQPVQGPQAVQRFGGAAGLRLTTDCGGFEFRQVQQLSQQVYDLLFPLAIAAGSPEATLHSGLDMLLMTMTSFTAGIIFIVVWMLSQAFNVLILLCPFSLGDAILAGAKNSLVLLIIGLSGTYAGALLSLAVIAFAVYLFPKTLRLVVFGTVMSHDLVFYKLFRSRAGSLPTDGIKCFSSSYLGRIPPLTYGKLIQKNGLLQFSYRSCLFFGTNTVNTGVEPLAGEMIRGIISPVIVAEQDDGEQIPERYEMTKKSRSLNRNGLLA